MNDSQSPASAPPPRSSMPLLAAVFGCLTLMAGAVLLYQRMSAQRDNYSDSGLNFNRVESQAQNENPSRSGGGPAAGAPGAGLVESNRFPAQDQPGGSGLGMIRGGGMNFGSRQSNRKDSAGATLTQAVRRNEARYRKLAEAYTRKYPIIRRYGEDWMRYPDLHRYNDEYFKDHDPIKFSWNVARSPNFAALTKQYANRPEIIAFVRDAARQTPAELLGAVRDYLQTDNNAVNLLSRFTNALGLPAGLLAGLAGGQADPRQASSSILKSNPQLQGILQQNNIDPTQINAGFKPQQ